MGTYISQLCLQVSKYSSLEGALLITSAMLHKMNALSFMWFIDICRASRDCLDHLRRRCWPHRTGRAMGMLTSSLSWISTRSNHLRVPLLSKFMPFINCNGYMPV